MFLVSFPPFDFLFAPKAKVFNLGEIFSKSKEFNFTINFSPTVTIGEIAASLILNITSLDPKTRLGIKLEHLILI